MPFQGNWKLVTQNAALLYKNYTIVSM